MAINQNHTAEELNGIKCAIVEKNVTRARAAFLEKLLTHNHFEVVIANSPAPKVAAAKPATETAPVEEPVPVETFTVGVTNLMFNPINAVFGRLLHTTDGHVVTLSYWQQKDNISQDEIPYFENR